MHLGKYCYDKIFIQTFSDIKRLALNTNNQVLYLKNMSDTQNSSDKSDSITYSVCQIKS